MVGPLNGEGQAPVATNANKDCIGYINPDFASLLEAIQGDHMLSMGGEQSVKDMFAGESLENKKIMEMGSGLGGPLFILAEHHKANFTGIEFNRELYERALVNQKSYQGLKGDLEFIHMNSPEELSKIPSNSFDFIFAKQYFFLIPFEEQAKVLKQIFRILKPGGKFIMVDWVKKGEFSDLTLEMLNPNYVRYSIMDIVWILSQLSRDGFVIEEEKELTSDYIQFVEKNIDTLSELKNFISEKFGQDIYKLTKVSFIAHIQAFRGNQIGVMFIKAEKPRAHNSTPD